MASGFAAAKTHPAKRGYNKSAIITVALVALAGAGWFCKGSISNLPNAAHAMFETTTAIPTTAQIAKSNTIKAAFATPPTKLASAAKMTSGKAGATDSLFGTFSTLKNFVGNANVVSSDAPSAGVVTAAKTAAMMLPFLAFLPPAGDSATGPSAKASQKTATSAVAANKSAASTAAPAAKKPAPVAPLVAQVVRPERTIAQATTVSKQFRVSCILFSCDGGSTAIINGMPVKVGQIIRTENSPQSGCSEEAVIKTIDRNSVEIELKGERYTLRI
jgi:hypothetical protein